MTGVNYDQIAANYDRRYAVDPLGGIASALNQLAADLSAESILEVGCGTGRWLNSLAATPAQTLGLDASMAMLRRAQERDRSLQTYSGFVRSRFPETEG